MPSKKNREPLAVKIAKKVLNDQLVRNVEYKPEIVFDDDFHEAIWRELRDLKPETLGRIIVYGVAYGSSLRTSMYEGAGSRAPAGEHYAGTGRLKCDATSVIRAAMIDLIKANNKRLTDEHIRAVCPEL